MGVLCWLNWQSRRPVWSGWLCEDEMLPQVGAPAGLSCVAVMLAGSQTPWSGFCLHCQWPGLAIQLQPASGGSTAQPTQPGGGLEKRVLPQKRRDIVRSCCGLGKHCFFSLESLLDLE